MQEPPRVSVLLPVRDAASTLDACFRSLVDQSFEDWECIAVDDGSTDQTPAILGGWAARDPRIRTASAPAPGGIVRALEEARRHARGSLIARQDADDRSLPHRLARQVEAMARDETLAAIGCMTRTPGDLTDGMRRYLEWLGNCIDPETCAREIWIESPIAHPTAMIRAAALAGISGYEEVDWPEDYDLWLRLHRAGGRIANVPEVLYEWTDTPGRLSRRDPRYAPDAFLRCRVHHLRCWLVEKRMTRPLVVWGAGRDGRRLARAWEVERASGAAAPRGAPPAGRAPWIPGPVRMPAPPGIPDPADVSAPAGISNPVDVSAPAGIPDPVDVSTPAGTPDPADVSTPAGISNPVGMPAPETQTPDIAAFVDIDPRKIGRRRRGRPILDPESARRAHSGSFFLVAVGVPGARGLIRSMLADWGMSEGTDYFCLH